MNQTIKKIVKKTGTSFFLGMYMLPLKERRAIYTLYAFCRHIDDIVDGQAPLSHKLELLDAWRREIDNIYDKKVPASDIGRNIYKNCMRFNIPKTDINNLLSSVSMDLPTPLQAPSMSEFMRYCNGIAGSPIGMTLHILGCTDEKLISDLSSSLGLALAITNILRNIRDDAGQNRLYIPQDFLLKANITSTDPMMVVVDKNLSVAREELAKMAVDNYQRATDLIKLLPPKAARSINAVAYIYRYYFDIMQNRGWEVISPKPQIKCLTKIFLIIKGFIGR